MLHQKYDNLLTPKIELDPNIGKLLNNRYFIRDLIGKGRLGKVYLAEDTAKSGTPVAIKILFFSLLEQQMYQRFVQEIFIATQLGFKNNHIVRVLGYGITEDKNPFYVMEYLQGKNLNHAIDSRSLTLSNFLNICHQICLGLRCAHMGITLKGRFYPIIHRNLKPENIFITDDIKKGKVIKILDFGIANFLAKRFQLKFTESLIYNLPYCSPEYMEEHKLLDVRSDIYSLGIIMYEMLAGKHPLYSKNHTFGSWYEAHRYQIPINFQEIIPQFKIPHKLQKLVMSCLAKDATLRPQNIDEVIKNLEEINLNSDYDYNQNKIIFQKNESKINLASNTSFSEKKSLKEKWPQNYPIALNCFPHILNTPQGNIPSIMVMLPKKEIKKNIKQSHYTELITQTDLYPMLLWITILEAPKLESVGWLSYFFDLKDKKNLNFIRLLSELGYYHLLFFQLEKPENCSHVQTIFLSPHQRQELAIFLESYQLFKPIISSKQSQAFLKLKFEKIKQNKLYQITGKSKIQKIANHFSGRNLLDYLKKLVNIL